MNDKVTSMLGVSDIASILGVSISLGFSLAIRELYNDLIAGDGCEKLKNHQQSVNPELCKKWYMILLRIIVRVTGSTSGAWLSALAINLCGLPQMEMLFAGIGGAMGWKMLDSVQNVFFKKLIETVKTKLNK